MRDAAEYGEGGEGDADQLGAGQFASKSHDQLVALLKEREHAIEALTMKYEQQRRGRGDGGAPGGGGGATRG